MENLVAWILRAIPFGTIIMFGGMGETLTGKIRKSESGASPGIMYLGALPGFASAYFYETSTPNPVPALCVVIALLSCVSAPPCWED